MVKPIITSLTPKIWAITTAPQTRMRELTMSNTRPVMSQNTDQPMGSTARVASFSISWVSGSAGFRFASYTVHPINKKKAATRTSESIRESPLSMIRMNDRIIIATRIGTSFRKTDECTSIGLISAVTPRISAIFAMFEPYALPSAIPGLPSSAESADTSISGADVPNPMMMIPINSGFMPR